MKPSFGTNKSFSTVLCALAAIGMSAAANADGESWVRLKGTDENGTSSMTSGGNWNPEGIPDGNNDYLVSGKTTTGSSFALRTPQENNSSTTFSGRSLQIGVVGGDAGRIMAKGNDSTVTYANRGLFLANGSYLAANDQLQQTIAGAVTVLAPATAPFQITSEYKTWTRFVVAASLSSGAEAGLQINSTKATDNPTNFEVRITGAMTDWNGSLSVAHSETTLSLASQTIPGGVSVDAAGAVLALQSATDVLTVGALSFSAANSMLKVRTDDATGTNSIIRVTSGFSAVSGVKVAFVDSDGALVQRLHRSAYPIIEIGADVADVVDASAFICANVQDDDSEIAFGVSDLMNGSRLLYAYSRISVPDAIDAATPVSLSRSPADGETQTVSIGGFEKFFDNAVLHLDASENSTVILSGNSVVSWKDPARNITINSFALGRTSNPVVKALPTYSAIAAGSIQRGIIDFGQRSASFENIAADCTGSAMSMARYTGLEFYSVVADSNCATENKRNVLGFGHNTNMSAYTSENSHCAENRYPFRRDGKKILNRGENNNKDLVEGGIFVDGKTESADYVPVLGELHVYAFFPTAPVTVNTIAAGRYDAVGGEKVGELAAFPAANSAARRTAIQSYLRRKWLGSETFVEVPLGKIAVEGTGTLSVDCGDYCSISPSEFEFSMSVERAPGKVSVAGALVIPASGVVTVNVEGGGAIRSGEYRLVEADAILNGGNLAGWTVYSGERNAGKDIRLVAKSGGIYMTVGGGMAIIIR